MLQCVASLFAGSYKNTVPLFGSKEDIEKAGMSIVTDSSGERPENVYAIHRLLKSADELDSVYEAHKGRYGDLKKLLASDLEAMIAPMRERYHAISDDEVRIVLADGAKRAHGVSRETLTRVRDAVGITI